MAGIIIVSNFSEHSEKHGREIEIYKEKGYIPLTGIIRMTADKIQTIMCHPKILQEKVTEYQKEINILESYIEMCNKSKKIK